MSLKPFQKLKEVQPKKTKKENLREFLMLTLGTLLVAVGVYFFKFPNHFSTGGVSGISIILGSLLPHITPASLMFAINMFLLLLGFLVFGKDFGIKTAYCSTLLSSATWILERIIPMNQPFTDQPLLELCFAVGLPAVGSAILFNIQGSTGGTDVVAMILKKFTHLDIGKALMLSDIVITFSSFAFGIQTGLFSILGLVAKSLMVDMVIENINMCKYLTIITSNPEPICDYIIQVLHRGATTYDAKGAFNHDNKEIILTAMRRGQAVLLRQFVRSVDPKAFVLITNTSEIVGKGFRGVS